MFMSVNKNMKWPLKFQCTIHFGVTKKIQLLFPKYFCKKSLSSNDLPKSSSWIFRVVTFKY